MPPIASVVGYRVCRDHRETVWQSVEERFPAKADLRSSQKKPHLRGEMWPCLTREMGGSRQNQMCLFFRFCVAFGELGFVERSASGIERGNCANFARNGRTYNFGSRCNRGCRACATGATPECIANDQFGK